MTDFNNFLQMNWTNQYVSSDFMWLNESLNCEKVTSSLTNDWSFINFLLTPSFTNTHFFIDGYSNISSLDVMLLQSINKDTLSPTNLYLYFINDISNSLNHFFVNVFFLLKTSINDTVSPILIYNPELILALNDYCTTYFDQDSIYYSVSSLFNSYTSNMYTHLNSNVVYFAMFFIYSWLVIYLLVLNTTLNWNYLYNSSATRIILYFYSFAIETRIQFEAVFQTFMFLAFYWGMVIMTFDDDQGETIEFIDSSFFYFFTIIVLYLCYKHSIHYFAFLEASVSDGRSVNFISKQFFRDFLNTFSLILRFYILLFRINVYDTLDDFFDSYYIFVGDFDDDEYFNDMFVSVYGNLFFSNDNNDDRYIGLEDENSLFYDLFFIYFVVWGKLFYFICFIVEEASRLALAFYICYLIIFEVHSVNCSYSESNYFSNKRS